MREVVINYYKEGFTIEQIAEMTPLTLASISVTIKNEIEIGKL